MSTGASERYRLPRFRETYREPMSPSRHTDAGLEVSAVVDPYDPPLPRTLVSSWDSGPTLVANVTNKETTGYELPGEGKIMRTMEEGSRVYRHKTRRTYHEDVKKEKNNNDNNSSFTSSKRKPLGDKLYYMPRTDDDKLVSVGVPGLSTDTYVKKTTTTPLYSSSPTRHQRNSSSNSTSLLRQRTSSDASSNMNRPAYTSTTRKTVLMEDKSVQCNIKREKERDRGVRDNNRDKKTIVSQSRDVSREQGEDDEKAFEISQDFRVIKSQEDGSVSTFSDVSVLEDPAKKRDEKVLFSELETHTPTETILTREFHELKRDKDTVYLDNPAPRSGVNRTVEVTRSRPISRDNYSPSPTRTRVVTKSYGVNVGSPKYGPVDVTPRGSPALIRRTPKPPINHWYYDNGERNRLEVESPSRARNLAQETIEETISISNASSDEMIESHEEAHMRAVRSAVTSDGEVDVNANYKTTAGTTSKGGNSSHKSAILQSMHSPSRKTRDPSSSPFGRPGDVHSSRTSINSSPALTGGPPGMWFKSIDSDYRRNMAKNSDVRDKDDSHQFCSATLSRTNKRTPPLIDSSSVQSYTLDRKHLNDRKKKAALSSYTSLDPAAGHKRAPSLPEKDRNDSSLSAGMRRYNSTRDVHSGGYYSNGDAYRKGGLAAAFRDRQDRASSLSRSIDRSHHGSDFALSSSRYDPRPRSRPVYDSEPEVHFVPVKEPGRSFSILSSKRRPEKNSIGSNKSNNKDKGPGVHFAVTSKEYSTNPSGSEMISEKGKKDLKRSQSIPKDTKFPWLNKFRIKSKARDP